MVHKGAGGLRWEVTMLGIDVSKDHLVSAYFDRARGTFAWERTVPNTPAGIRQLLAATPPDCPWVLEPTGRYSIPAAQMARDAGRPVLLAPPRKTKAYLASVSSRAKTDRVDGRGIALFAVSRTAANPLPAYPLKSEAVAQLDQLLSARKGLVQALMSLKQRLPELPHARPHLEATVTDLQARLKELDAEIARHASDQTAYPALAELRKVPGIGPVTAATVLARLTGRDFPRADQFVAFIGLDVTVFQSGKRQGERGLTKQGDAYLRRLFYLAAIAHVKSHESPYRALFERQLAQGNSRVAAYNAVARKLARLCWSLVKHDSTYEPDRVHTPANPPKQAATEPPLNTAPEAQLPAAAVPNSSPVPSRRVRLGSSQRANPSVRSPQPPKLDLT